MSDLNFQLLNWQKEVLSDPTRFKVVVAGRRCGKTRLAIVTLLIKALECPRDSNITYVAPTQGQARRLIWQPIHDLGRSIIAKSHVNNMEITLINGVTIYICGADNPDTLRGPDNYHIVMDEYADIKPVVWEQVLRASLSRYKGGALFIGTPKARNHFYDQVIYAESGVDPEWKAWRFVTADNELIDKNEIEAAKASMSSFAFKQEYLASFDTIGTDVFKEEWIRYAHEPEGSYFIAVDLAGFEEVRKTSSKNKLDRTAIAVVKVTDDGKWWVKKVEVGRWDVRENAVRILKNIREFRPMAIGIERGALYNAVMPYLTDLMRKNNCYAHVRPLTHGNQRKEDRVIWALQGMFEHGRILLNKDEDWREFIEELLLFPSNGVHDDMVDSLSLINQMAVTNYFRHEEEDEYEPLDIITGI